MVFDVRWNVFMMWKCRGKICIIWMRKIIVPIQAFFTTIDLVAVRNNDTFVEINFFSHPQTQIVRKIDFSFRDSRVWTV
jgi:hypothetical protein